MTFLINLFGGLYTPCNTKLLRSSINLQNMLLQDCWVFSPKVDSSENLVFTVKIQKSYYSEWMRQFIFNTYNEWKTLDFEVVWIDDKNDEIPKLRQRLAMVMTEYSRKTKTPPDEWKNALYARYRVSSRSDLSREQLEEAIRFYSDGIMYDI